MDTWAWFLIGAATSVFLGVVARELSGVLAEECLVAHRSTSLVRFSAITLGVLGILLYVFAGVFLCSALWLAF